MTPLIARVLLYATAAGWGISFIANHELLEVLDPFQIVTLRAVGVAAAFVIFFTLVPSKRPHLSRRDWWLLTLGGLLTVPGAQILAVTGQLFLSPGMSGLVATSAPAIAAVIAYRFLGERLTRRRVAGIAVALAGVVVVVVFATGTGTDLTVANPFGAALMVVSQVSWAGYTVLGRTLAVRHDPLTMVGTAFLIGCAMVLPLLPHALAGVGQLDGAQWWWLVHLVIGGTLVPHVMWFIALRHLSANETVTTMYLVPLYGLLFSVLILDERLSAIGLVGGAAILVGVGIAQGRGRSGEPVDDEALVTEPGV